MQVVVVVVFIRVAEFLGLVEVVAVALAEHIQATAHLAHLILGVAVAVLGMVVVAVAVILLAAAVQG
jgi:hypothetical protein